MAHFGLKGRGGRHCFSELTPPEVIPPRGISFDARFMDEVTFALFVGSCLQRRVGFQVVGLQRMFNVWGVGYELSSRFTINLKINRKIFFRGLRLFPQGCFVFRIHVQFRN
ncbi:hypothetical protein CEXT_481911 [Caerostris extrusa]|uniref:Uncharacterized protein n=1 Tax=Caerostris extrusa TaxID=172846 RepID=A0AAV4UF05_CAEEX|nr:hypothetical protein CEXT_481911 [Caerostris extrusa]